MKTLAALLASALLAPIARAQPVPPPPLPSQPAPPPQPARPVNPVDGLLAALKAAPNEETAAQLEAQIRKQWQEAASPAIRLLLSRGQRELSEDGASDAFDSYDAALDLDPALLEAWRGRAAARSAMGDTTGAVHDIEEVLKREPRDFAALQDLSHIAEARGDWRGALEAWQKLLEIDPHTPGAQDRLKELKRRAIGEET